MRVGWLTGLEPATTGITILLKKYFLILTIVEKNIKINNLIDF